jgi:dCMP deaminase
MFGDVWDNRFMRLAKEISSWSKDPSCKVGAVLVDEEKRIVGTGYNGFPRGVADTEELYFDKEQKYPRIVHAELNAILNAFRDLKGAVLYIYPLPPCPECTKAIIQSGIKQVVIVEEQDPGSKWLDAFKKHSLLMMIQANVLVRKVSCGQL